MEPQSSYHASADSSFATSSLVAEKNSVIVAYLDARKDSSWIDGYKLYQLLVLRKFNLAFRIHTQSQVLAVNSVDLTMFLPHTLPPAHGTSLQAQRTSRGLYLSPSPIC